MSNSNTVADDFPDHLFDREQYMEMKMVTGAIFNSLLKKFCTDSRLQLQGIREAALHHDTETLRKCAHKLKGSSGTIGAKVLTNACHLLEERARSGNVEGAAEFINVIGVHLDEVIATIDKLVST